jgi:hypothetical protein
MFRTRLIVGFALVQMVSFATAQDTIVVSCCSGKNCDILRARKVKGAVISSATGKRAYVLVSANTPSSGSCSNVTQLFISGRTGEFHKVFEAQPTQTDDGTDDGNGMRLIGWNRSGTKLMAELGRFAYGTDTGMSREIIIYNATTAKVSHVDVEAALSKYFTQGCAFRFATKAWHEPNAAVVEVREYRDNYLDETIKSCVQQPSSLIVELSTGAVSQVSRP